MIIPSPLGAEILALSTADRARFAARLIDAGQMPEIALLILNGVVLDVLQLCIAREATWKEEALPDVGPTGRRAD